MMAAIMAGVNDEPVGDRAGAGERAAAEVAGERGSVSDGVDHLQAAARELIDAARAFLDVVEELVGDRDRLAEVAETVGAMAGAAARTVARARSGTGPAGDETPPSTAASPPRAGEGVSRVQRITVT
jgi:hypothetical protein